jgi:hypothetical protein
MFGANGGAAGPGPTGWYVVTPGIGGATVINALDPGGNTVVGPGGSTIHWTYPAGAAPNGTPLAHPGDISVSGVGTRRKGVIWAPYVVGGTYSIDLLEGGPLGTMSFATVLHTVGSGQAPPGNFSAPLALAALPKQNPPATWPGTTILQDQKSNFKAEYGLIVTGY